MRIGWMAVALLLAAGCYSPAPHERTPEEQAMFGPATMRIHPLFTQIRDFNGDAKDDGVEALVEFDDSMGDPTKAAGTILFELFDYRKGWPDPRGGRLAKFVGSIVTAEQQRAHWDGVSRAYKFELRYDGLRPGKDYVLTALFEPTQGERLPPSQVVLEAQPPSTQPIIPQENEGGLPTTNPGPGLRFPQP